MSRQIPKVSFISFLKQAKSILKNPLPFHKKNFALLGDIFQVNLGFGNRVIFTRDAELAKHMLQLQHKKYYKSPIQTDALGHYIGHGLLTSNGDFWLKQRRLIQPAFYKKKLESIKDIVIDTINNSLKLLEDGKTIDVHPIMSDLAFNVVSKSLFSYSDDGETISRLQSITEQVQINLIKEIRQPFKKWWFKLNGHIKKTEALAQESRDLLFKMIEQRQQSRKTHDDLLDMLLASTYQDGSKMSTKQLIDEILILFAAGHETTSNALVFTLMLLAKHPEIQCKLYNEVKALDPEDMDMLDFFKQTSFTKNCIDEAMRLYPPAYFSDRIAIEDDFYKGLELKKGTSILMSFYEIHRSKAFWDKPEVYWPERYSSISKKELSDWFYPFGAGPRMCVGSNLAMYEMLVTISEIVKKYQMKPVSDKIELQPLITLKPLESKLMFNKQGI